MLRISRQPAKMLRSTIQTTTQVPVYRVNGSRQLNTDFVPAPPLMTKDLNHGIIEAQYAVRGPIPNRADELAAQLQKDPSSLPFSKIINSNIGNPQQLDQKPLTFYRRVLSILQNPELLDQVNYPPDVIARAKRLLDDVGSVGAYSASSGVAGIRKTVAEFITKRDGYFSHPDDIILTGGASSAVYFLLSLICRGEETGVLIPIPQYPLYTASLTMARSHALPYYLKEKSNWSLDATEIEQQVLDAKAKGIKPRCLVIINPGNPTGSIMSRDDIADIITIAAKHGLVIIADEVYQENIFNGEFISMKRVLSELTEQFPGKYEDVQLASLHSTSKGVSGECGQRGGYMEVVGFSSEFRAALAKLTSISLCTNITGQCLVDLMVCPPQEGEPSYELDQQERKAIHDALDFRAHKLYHVFSQLEGIECQMPQGAMYLFPKILMSEKAIAAATENGQKPDEFYCLSLLEQTGICTVPGSGFGQEEGTFHVRTTVLPPGEEWINDWKKFHHAFHNKYK